MTAAQVVLIAIAGWIALSVVVAVVLFPLPRSARRSDELEGGTAHGSSPHGGLPSWARIAAR